MSFAGLIQFFEIIERDLERRGEKVPNSVLELHKYCERSTNRKFDILTFNELFDKSKSDLLMLVQGGYIYIKAEEEKDQFFSALEMFKDQVLTDLNPEIIDIKKAMSISMRRVISYYKKYGINLGYFPSFEYVGNHPTNSGTIAGVSADEYSKIQYQSLISALGTRFYFKKYFNLNLSQEAVEEAIELHKKLLIKRLPKKLIRKRLIMLYNPIFNVKQERQLDHITAHEVWHLIEDAYGVAYSHGFICEGTATYAELRYARENARLPSQNTLVEWLSDNGLVDKSAFDVLLYMRTAAVVEQIVQNEKNPYGAILLPRKREKIKQIFEEKVLPSLIKKYEERFPPLDLNYNIENRRRIVRTNPAFSNFRKKPTRENYLKAMRVIGAKRLAENLSKQNIDALLNYQRGLIA